MLKPYSVCFTLDSRYPPVTRLSRMMMSNEYAGLSEEHGMAAVIHIEELGEEPTLSCLNFQEFHFFHIFEFLSFFLHVTSIADGC